MGILIAESGSTKCNWVLINENGVEENRWDTIGFNPYFIPGEKVVSELKNAKELNAIADKISQIWFYGAGCSSAERCLEIKSSLDFVFKNSKNHVGHDLEASAFSLYRGKPVVACIIGTGSNSCYFDGDSVTEELPNLSYVLGDEGSASYIGKHLLRAYLYKQMPEDLATEFGADYSLSKNEVLDKLYNQPNPNLFLAGLGPFAGKHKSHPFVLNILKMGFIEFIKVHVACFKNVEASEISFVGSVASFYQDILQECVQECGLEFGQIVARPIDELVNYHLKYLGILGK